jgi:hypothetical protein
MKGTLETINQMEAAGVIGRYAIGGAVGATFYLEPAATLDIDIFISLQKAAGSRLLSLAPIYEYLTAGTRCAGRIFCANCWACAKTRGTTGPMSCPSFWR